MAGTKPNQTSITPESRKKMPLRGKGKKSLMLDAIRATCTDEHEYLKKVVKESIGDELADPPIPPNPVLMNMVLQRIEPPMKSVMPMVEFEFSEDKSPSAQASQVMKAAAEGVIPPDIAGMFVSSIASMMKIEEVTELAKRLDEIEKALGIDG